MEARLISNQLLLVLFAERVQSQLVFLNRLNLFKCFIWDKSKISYTKTFRQALKVARCYTTK